MVATVARQTAAVRALVEAGADVDIRDNRLAQPVPVRRRRGPARHPPHRQRGRRGPGDHQPLRRHRADPGLASAATSTSCATSSRRATSTWTTCNNLGWTGAAARRSSSPMATRPTRRSSGCSLEHGADPELADRDGVTPLAARSREGPGGGRRASSVGARRADRCPGPTRSAPGSRARRASSCGPPGVPEGDLDLLVVAGQLRGDHDAVAPARVAHPVAVAVAALARDDRPRRDDAAFPGPGPAGVRRRLGRIGLLVPGRDSAAPGSDPMPPPSRPSDPTAPRPRRRRASRPGPASAGTSPPAPAPPAGRSPAGTRRRPPGSPPRTATRAPGTRGPGPGPRRCPRRRAAAARPSAPPGSPAGTGSGCSCRRRPTSRAARRGRGTAAASPA